MVDAGKKLYSGGTKSLAPSSERPGSAVCVCVLCLSDSETTMSPPPSQVTSVASFNGSEERSSFGLTSASYTTWIANVLSTLEALIPSPDSSLSSVLLLAQYSQRAIRNIAQVSSSRWRYKPADEHHQ